MTAPTAAADRFERPSPAWFAVLDGGAALLTAMAVNQRVYDAVARRVRVPSRRMVRTMLIGTAAVHVGEAVYAYRTAKENGFDRSAPRWAVQTFVVGFPSLLKLREAAVDAAAATAEAA